MDKYTFEDLIINPETPGLEDLIGREVYFNDVPLTCLTYANENRSIGILREVRKGSDYPFRVETSEESTLNFACIIPKKEEPKPEYIPFKSMEEFVERYTEVKEGVEFNSFEDNLLQCGMWLQDKEMEAKWMVTEIWNDGVILGSNQSVIAWGELLKDYIFLDGTLCGRLKDDTV